MKSIEFKFENLKKIEQFAGVKIWYYSEIGDPSCEFSIINEDGSLSDKKLKLKSGDEIFKDSKGNLYIKLMR